MKAARPRVPTFNLSGLLLLPTLLVMYASVSSAQTINFTYNGLRAAGGADSGAGSITLNTYTGSVTLSNVTAFSFSDAVSIPSVGSGNYIYGLGDLTGFSATIVNGSVTSMTLTTGTVTPTGTLTQKLLFNVSSLSGAGLQLANSSSYTIGTVVPSGPGLPPTPVAEPSSLPMLMLCVLGLAGGFLFKARGSGQLLNT
jgi:hypothetical protein